MDIEEIKRLPIFDENEDGSVDDVLECRTNEFGQVVEVVLDVDKNGTPDMKIYFEYDESGRVIKESRDKNIDGKIDAVKTFKYEEDGSVSVLYDDNADGKYDYREDYDKNGNSTLVDLRDNKQKLQELLGDVLPIFSLFSKK